MKLIRLLRKDIARTDLRMPGYERSILNAARFFDETKIVIEEQAYLKISASRSTHAHLVPIGDVVERMLTNLGISKDRVRRWLRVKDCGCAARQKWLNKWGFRQQEKLHRLLNKAARWYGFD